MRPIIKFVIIAVTLICFPAVSFSQQPSKKNDAYDVLQTLIEQQQVVPFTDLTKLRWAVIYTIDDKNESSPWLKSEITVPLKSLGIEMVEQVREDIDIGLPAFVVAAAIDRSGTGHRTVFVQTSISRWVVLADAPSVKFMTSIWDKKESTTVGNLEAATLAVRSIVNRHISEIVRYWAQANARRTNPAKK